MRLVGYAVLALTVVASLNLGGCGPRVEQVKEVAASPPPEEMALPKPRLKGEFSLEEALVRRRSVRSFTEEELTLEEISQLLWAAQGLTADWGGRTPLPRPGLSIRWRSTWPPPTASTTTRPRDTK